MGIMKLAEHDPEGPGRPSLSGRRGQSPRITFRVPDDLYRLTQERAEADEVTVAEVARTALERYLYEEDR